MSVITLCGSTKFKEQFIEANKRLTLEGHIVISVGLFGHADGEPLTVEQKAMLDKIHIKKIDLSARIHVINVGGYIGKSTTREITHARRTGKLITYEE